MRLVYNNKTRTTSNSPGVKTRIPGFGNTSTVEWIDPSKASAGAYFKDIANMLVNFGYERNLSLRGAPYDFRKGPSTFFIFFFLYSKEAKQFFDYMSIAFQRFIFMSLEN